MSDIWFEPIGSAHAQRTYRGSRFIADLVPLTNPALARAEVASRRTAHPGASHVVHAFIIGPPKSRTEGSGDDGEPKGTAGRPVLDAIRGRRLTNTLVTIVRYFGGTKLGTGGLVHAYAETAAEALAAAETHELIERVGFSIVVAYSLHEALVRELVELGAEEIGESFDVHVRIVGVVEASRRGEFEATVADLSRGTAAIEFSTDRSLPGTR